MPVHKARTAWADALSQANVGGRATMSCPETFSASLTRYDFGQTTLNSWTVGPCEMKRTPRDCSRHTKKIYSLCFVQQGSFMVGVGRRESVVHQGDCYLISPMEPGLVINHDVGRFSSLHLPDEVIKNWLPYPEDATAIAFSKHTGWGNALSATMAALNPSSIENPVIAPHILVEQICGLLALAVGRSEPPTGSYQASLLLRFRDAIRERFHEPDFSPSALCVQEGVSKRTLHMIFASASTTFGTELLNFRLQRARQILDDARYDKMAIAKICRLVGFEHAGHFITRFRLAYGVTPFVYRSVRRT